MKCVRNVPGLGGRWLRLLTIWGKTAPLSMYVKVTIENFHCCNTVAVYMITTLGNEAFRLFFLSY